MIEAVGIIRPLGIAKVERVARERVGLERSPDGIGHVCTGVHRDVHAAGPLDVETELVCPHAEAVIAGQHVRFPQRGWTTTEACTPAGATG